MEEFELKLKIAPSDSAFKKLIGIEKYEEVKNKAFKKYNFTCQGCGYKPLDAVRSKQILSLHIIEFNEENPEESLCNILCKACHTTQHIDVAIEKGWIQLVNSTLSQKSLIEMCRTNNLYNIIKEDNIRYLKTNPQIFLQKMKSGEILAHTKAKIIFTNAFEWGEL